MFSARTPLASDTFTTTNTNVVKINIDNIRNATNLLFENLKKQFKETSAYKKYDVSSREKLFSALIGAFIVRQYESYIMRYCQSHPLFASVEEAPNGQVLFANVYFSVTTNVMFEQKENIDESRIFVEINTFFGFEDIAIQSPKEIFALGVAPYLRKGA